MVNVKTVSYEALVLLIQPQVDCSTRTTGHSWKTSDTGIWRHPSQLGPHKAHLAEAIK